MRLAVYTGGKVSKPKNASAAVARIEGLPEGPVTVNTIHRPGHPTPNSVAMHALALGLAVALEKGGEGVEVEVFSSSKNAIRAVDGTGGAKYETRWDALCAAWVIYWRCSREGRVSFAYRPAAEMPEVVDHATASLKRADAALAPSEPDLVLPL